MIFANIIILGYFLTIYERLDILLCPRMFEPIVG